MTSNTTGVGQTLPMGIRLRLSLMMFLQFFVWGAWFVTMGTFLGVGLSASGSQISLAYLTQSLGAIAAPLIIGLIADQFFSAQKSLASCTSAAPFCCGSLVTFRSSACSSR